MIMEQRAASQNTKDIKATPETLYRAFTDPAALATWLAPDDMTGKIHRFEPGVGGGYQMSLYYPGSGEQFPGKSGDREDRFTARFLELIVNKKIVQAINFDSADPAFSGEMIMEVTFSKIKTGTRVTITFRNIPAGIRPEDNEAGTASSLEKLARYVE